MLFINVCLHIFTFLSFCFFLNEIYPSGWLVSQHCYVFHTSKSLTPLRNFLSKVTSLLRACHVFLDSHGQTAMILLPEHAASLPNYILSSGKYCLFYWVFIFNTCLLCKFTTWHICLSLTFSLILFASHLKF